MIGESPQRPGSLNARPLVVVQPEISPLSLSAEQCMVPVGGNRTRRTAAMRNSGSMPSRAACPSRRSICCSQSSDCGSVVGDVAGNDDGGCQCGSANPGPHQSSVE